MLIRHAHDLRIVLSDALTKLVEERTQSYTHKYQGKLKIVHKLTNSNKHSGNWLLQLKAKHKEDLRDCHFDDSVKLYKKNTLICNS